MFVQWTRNCSIGLLLAGVVGMANGCQTPPRRTISDEELLERHPEYLRVYQQELEEMSAGSAQRIRDEYDASAGSDLDGRQSATFDVLILSGGGAFGAFGAGFLRGWGEISDPEFARPSFDQVSGISTGALIAPFAFLGTEEAYDTVVDFYENPGRDWVRERGLIPYLPGNVSLYDVAKLHDTIREAITPEMIEAIGREAPKNRQLLIGATNVDYGLLRVWDLARTASRIEPEEALEHTILVLQASSAIPGAFPPIVIDDLLYVDGGATMQVVGGTDERDWVYQPEADPFGFPPGGPPVRLRVWIIVNQKLLPDPSVVRSRWTSIAGRSLSALVRTSTLQSIQDAETYVRLIDGHPTFEAEMRFVAIPQDFSIPDSDEMFEAETMRSLVRLGMEMGRDPKNWRTKALRPGAPFQPSE